DSSPLLHKGAHLLPYASSRLHIQANSWFIQKNRPGIADEGQRERKPAFLPTAQSSCLTLLQPRQAKAFQHLLYRQRVGIMQLDQLEDLLNFQSSWKVCFLWSYPDLLARLGQARILTIKKDFALICSASP